MEYTVRRGCRPHTRLLAITLLPVSLCGLASASAGSDNGSGAENPSLILISIDGYRTDYRWALVGSGRALWGRRTASVYWPGTFSSSSQTMV